VRQPLGTLLGAGVDDIAGFSISHPWRGSGTIDNLRAESLALRHMDGLRAWADPGGGWHQVLDHPES
jgi:hypothetical protein